MNVVRSQLSDTEILAACERAAKKHPRQVATVKGVFTELGNRGGNDRIARHVRQFNDGKVTKVLPEHVSQQLESLHNSTAASGLAQIIAGLEEEYQQKQSLLAEKYEAQSDQLAEEYAVKQREIEARAMYFDHEAEAYKEEIAFLRSAHENHSKAVEGYIKKIAEQQTQLKVAEDTQIRFTSIENGYKLQLEQLNNKMECLKTELEGQFKVDMIVKEQTIEDLQRKYGELEEMYNQENTRLLLQVDSARQKTITVMEKAEQAQKERQKTIDNLMMERSRYKSEAGHLAKQLESAITLSKKYSNYINRLKLQRAKRG